MSDLFHEQVPEAFLDEVFAVILACATLDNLPHTFQVLTKRPERMLEYFTRRSPNELLEAWAKAGDGFIHVDDGDIYFSEYVAGRTGHDWDDRGTARLENEYKPFGYVDKFFPLPNLWIGVSVENQEAVDERIPLLLQTLARVRFLSCEPLLGPVDLSERGMGINCESCVARAAHWCCDPVLDWIIVGGESGPNARPMHPNWARQLRDQCTEGGVLFFFKQWSAFSPEVDGQRAYTNVYSGITMDAPVPMYRVGKKAAGRQLDGRTLDEYPFHERRCRVCGCTDECGCAGGCYWVGADLCSACVAEDLA